MGILESIFRLLGVDFGLLRVNLWPLESELGLCKSNFRPLGIGLGNLEFVIRPLRDHCIWE